MDLYYFSISTAAWIFPLVSGLIALPYVIYSYRKYGAVSVWRTLVLFSFVFYLQCAYCLIILPLPDPAVVANLDGPFYDLVPFHFVENFLSKSPFQLTQPDTWGASLKSATFLEPFFNFCLLMPFGIYLAYYFKRSWWKVMLFSFLLSLFFEMSQLTGLFGLYSKPYRIFSVDDLILNTLGGLIGFVVYTKCLRFLPRLEKVDQKIRRRGESVSFTRRLVALLIDSAVVGILQDLVSEFLKIDPVYVFGITLCAYTIIISLVSNGRTIGKALVRIKVSKMSTGLPFVIAIILRYLLRNAAITGIVFSNSTISVSDDQRVWLAIFAGISFFSVIDLLYSLRKGKRLWYDRISRTENVSTIKPRRIS